MTLGTDLLKTGLAIFSKRADTGSPWMLTNNPRDKYWDWRDGPWRSYWEKYYAENPDALRFFPNREFRLADIVRASAAAPTFLESVKVKVDEDANGKPVRGVFIDGAVSTNNNPALHLFLAATLRGYDNRSVDDARRTPYGFRWATGAERLYLLSLGTGARRDGAKASPWRPWSLIEGVQAIGALTTIIQDTVEQGVMALQAMSAPAKPVRMNSQIEKMEGLLTPERPLLTFHRIDPRLELKWLNENLPEGPPVKRAKKKTPRWASQKGALKKAGELDEAGRRNLDLLHHIGRAYAERALSVDDFPAAFDIEPMGGGAVGADARLGATPIDLVERIARTSHEALRGFKASAGQDPGPSWEDAEPWMRESTLEAVAFRIANPSAPASAEHERWLREKEATGWVYGEVKDAEAKTHPMMVEYAHLPEDERKKDALIMAVADALAR